MKFGEMLKQQGAGLLGNAASGVMGMIFGGANDKRQLAMQEKLNAMQLENDMALMNMQHNKQFEMWQKTGPVGMVEQLEKAGLNPGLYYGGGGGSGQTVGGGMPSSGKSNAPVGGGEIIGMMQLQAQQANIELMKAQAEKTRVEAANIGEGGIDTLVKEIGIGETKGRIAMQELESIIKDYTGKDLKREFDIKNPARGIEAKTYEDELSARQGIAGTIYDLWVEGKLEEKSLNEIESIAINNAKNKEEIENIKKQGKLLDENIDIAKLNKMILQLEQKLQSKTGIDRNSNGFLKILGRLFVNYFDR